MERDERRPDPFRAERLAGEIGAGIRALRRAMALASLRRRRWRPPGRRPPGPPPARVAALAAALASGEITVGEVAGLLRIAAADVPAIAAGRVGLGRRGWRRLELLR